MSGSEATPPPARRRRWRRALLTASLVVVATLGAFGCTSTVTPPASPRDPVEVFVLAEAMHTGLVLPPDPGASGEPDQFVEFGFGDWSWYALGNDAWYHTFATVLWPTQGALGRRTFGARTAAELRRRASWASLSPVVVERDAAAALRRRLQATFDAARRRVVVQPAYGFRFVPSEHSYWFPRNCVDRAAVWLEELGCDVSWCAIRTGLEVVAEGG